MLQNLIKVFIAVLIVSSVFFFFSRKMSSPTNEVQEDVTEVAESQLPDDFRPFYDRFHTDSIFQIEHISFPLMGIGQSRDTTEGVVQKTWLVDQWKIHGPFNSQEGLWDRTFINETGVITESQSARDGLFTLEKRYAKLAGEWHLIYYQEVLMHG